MVPHETLCDFQRVDPENGLIQPWLTHGALDEIKTWDLKDKVIWEWGAGLGDLWLKNRCKELHVVERKTEWFLKCMDMDNKSSIFYHFRPCDDCSGEEDVYCSIPEDLKPDVFIIDDAYRYECLVKALNFALDEIKPCTIIVDNWQQDRVFICPAAEQLMQTYNGQFFIQPDHKDHEGRPWCTAIWKFI